ncbi:hypothetical protein ACWEVD_00760 [Nocardia thailandica]
MTAEPARLRPVATGDDHPDLVTADAAAARYAAAATPPNTTRTYASAWRQFETWCEATGSTALPATSRTVERFLAARAETGIAASTLAVGVAAIAARHTAAGHPDPTLDSAVRQVMDGVRAAHTAAGRTRRRAPAATTPVLTALVTTAHTSAVTWVQQVAARRDIALLTLAFSIAGRRVEAAGLNTGDLTLTTDGERLLQVRLRGTKTRRTELSYAYVPAGKGAALLCPWCALHRWLILLNTRDDTAAREHARQFRTGRTTINHRLLGMRISTAVQATLAADTSDPHEHRCTDRWPEPADPDGALFRPLGRTGLPQEGRLSDRQIARVIATRGAAAGYPGLKGHSLRAGAGTEAFDRGNPLEDVMALGRWANPATALSYDRNRQRRSARVDLGL